MVSTMTNRMLGLVVAFALTSGIVAHAAQTPRRPLAPVTLPTATSLPMTLQTALGHIGETATGAVDPRAAIRDAYQRDHVALEHLRQRASQLKGSAHMAFNQLVSDDESTLRDIERTALATSRPVADSTIAAMDTLVTSADAELSCQLALASKMSSSQNPHQPSQSGSEPQTND